MNRYTKIVAGFFVLLVFFCGARPANALFGDDALAVKEYTLDPIVYAISRVAIQSMVRSTVNWINSGFQGSPAFATDLRASLLDAADQEANLFIQQLRSDLRILSPHSEQIASDVMRIYYLSTSADSFFIRNPYDLNQYSEDPAALGLGNIYKGGGIHAWVAQTLNPSNNQLGSFLGAESELAQRVGSVRQQLETEVTQNGGFFSWRRCDQELTSVNAGPATNETSLTTHTTCLKSHVETPGSVIATQLNHSIGLGADSLVQADEINEIVNALMAQLLNNVLGGTGLAGLSSGSAASGGRGYFDQTTTSSSGTTEVSVLSAFLQVVDTQITPLQTYLANWQTINNAAQAAKASLENSTCVSDATAASLISTEVQPVMNQAAQVIGSVPGILNQLDSIRSQALQSATQSSAQQTTTLNQVSATYQVLLSSNTLPSSSDLAYATAQAQDSGNTLLSRMNQLTSQGHCAP